MIVKRSIEYCWATSLFNNTIVVQTVDDESKSSDEN